MGRCSRVFCAFSIYVGIEVEVGISIAVSVQANQLQTAAKTHKPNMTVKERWYQAVMKVKVSVNMGS